MFKVLFHVIHVTSFHFFIESIMFFLIYIYFFLDILKKYRIFYIVIMNIFFLTLLNFNILIHWIILLKMKSFVKLFKKFDWTRFIPLKIMLRISKCRYPLKTLSIKFRPSWSIYQLFVILFLVMLKFNSFIYTNIIRLL